MTPQDAGEDGGRGASLEAANGAPGWSADVLTRAASKPQEPGASESGRP
jgi:hypothetical protein